MKRLVMIGMIMLGGSIVRGADPVVTVSIAIPKVHKDGNYYVKVNGAIGGSHSCSDATYTAKGVKMTGPGAGKVWFGVNNTWLGNAGEKPSQNVNDTRVVVTYSKKKEPKITGSAELTVVGVKGSFVGQTAFPFKLGRVWTGTADVLLDVKGSPKTLSFGDVQLSFTAPGLLQPKKNPLLVQKGGNKFRFNLQVQSLIRGGLLNSKVILTCPFGPKGLKFNFGATGVFRAGIGAVVTID